MEPSKDSAIFQLAQQTSFGFFKDIDNLTSDSTFKNAEFEDAGNLTEITRQHWKPSEERACCFNGSCRKQFSALLLERRHHCRRCGEIFCQNCLQYSRRLNLLAHPDPDGELYKVCKACFEHGKLTDGQARKHTNIFDEMRAKFHRRSDEQIGSQLQPQLNFDVECERLLKGFGQSFGNSEFRGTLHEMKNMVSKPEWIRSSMWLQESFASCCQICQGEFSKTRKKKKFCCVCGICMCKGCSSKDLLVYIPDREKDMKERSQPKLAIIRIVGSPEVEPEISMYLRVCPSCKERLEDRQVDAFEEEINPLAKYDFMDLLSRLDESFQTAERRVKVQLPKYREIVESLEDDSTKTNTDNNVKTLAKAQGDLADALAQHVTIVQQLKKLKPLTPTQALLFQTYIRAKCKFYLDNQTLFRQLQHKLSDAIPAESLDFVQSVMDQNAIVDTHIYLKQLVCETTHLCDQFKLEDNMPSLLLQAEQCVESEVRTYLTRQGEDVKEHMELVEELITASLKDKKLVHISDSLYQKHGTEHAIQHMHHRVQAVLNKVNNQLQLRTVDCRFSASKRALEKLIDELGKWNDKSKLEEKDFVSVEK